MYKYQLSKSSNPRKHSPLAYIDFNVPERISPDKFIKAKIQADNRTKRVLSHAENPHTHLLVNLNHHHQASSHSKPRLVFSAKGKTNIRRPSSAKGNLMTTINIKAKCGIPIKLQVKPFHLNQQLEAKEPMTEKQFLKIRQLGRGKFGTVWLAIHKKTNFLCALKIISKAVVRQQKVVHQVAKQLRIHNNLKHRNVINFFGFFEEKESFFIITEYATQGNVFARLKQCHRLEENEVKDYTIQTVEGLKYVHNRGYIHRDIKPQNLLLQFGVVKICDFGWAAECSGDDMRQSQCGTPLYYSPEIVKKEAYSLKIDVWSVGLLAYELIVGRVPFKIWSEFDLPIILKQEVSIPDYVDFSEQLNSFVSISLTKDQQKRPNIAELQRHPFLRVNDEQTFSSELWIQMSSVF